MSESAVNPSQQASFQIEKIYVKDVSLEVPNAPQVFMQQAQPQVEVRIDTSAEQFGDGLYEATVIATVSAKAGDKTLFLAEAVQAGVFQMRNVPEEDIKPLLGIACPTILFPYVRETISDLVVRGGFPPILLAPVSFEALYAQRQSQAEGEQPKIEIAR